jgi:hypothetical protein
MAGFAADRESHKTGGADQLRTLVKATEEEKILASTIVSEMPTVIQNRITRDIQELEKVLGEAMDRRMKGETYRLEWTRNSFSTHVCDNAHINRWKNLFDYVDRFRADEDHIRRRANHNNRVLEIVYGKLFGSFEPDEYEKYEECRVTIEGMNIEDYRRSEMRNLAKKLKVAGITFLCRLSYAHPTYGVLTAHLS